MSLQKEFLQRVKSRLPENMSFVDELAELFSVSNDSAYRRIRGETALTFEELAKTVISPSSVPEYTTQFTRKLSWLTPTLFPAVAKLARLPGFQPMSTLF